jgi:aminopeptidase S
VKQLGTTFSGVNDLATGLSAGAAAGDFDIDGGVTSIQSPPIALPSSGTLTLSFSYYLAHGSNSSSADFLRVFVVGSTTTQVFQELGAANNDNGAWATTSANISAFAGQTVRIRIEAADASTASLVEAGIDDVLITQQ